LTAHLTARWCEGVVPAIGVVAHGGPTGLDGSRWCVLLPATLLQKVAAGARFWFWEEGAWCSRLTMADLCLLS